MNDENEVRQGIQQAKVGEIGIGIITLEVLGLTYYAGHASGSTGLGLLAFIILMFVFFGVSNNEKISACFSLIMGAVVAVVLFIASVIEAENTLLVSVLVSFLIGAVVIGGNFSGLQHLRDIGAMSPGGKEKGGEECDAEDSKAKSKKTSAANIRSCKSCHKDVEISLKECPHCGIANPALTKKDYLIVFGTIVIIAVVLSFWLLPEVGGLKAKSFVKTMRDNASDLSDTEFIAEIEKQQGNVLKGRAYVESVYKDIEGNYELRLDIEGPDKTWSVHDIELPLEEKVALPLSRGERISFSGEIVNIEKQFGSSVLVTLKNATIKRSKEALEKFDGNRVGDALVEEPPLASLEELKIAYEISQGRASIIKTLRIMVEPMVEIPNQTQITQDLLNAQTACKNLSYQASIEKTPQTDKELADLYHQMNSALSFASGAICDRIEAAIDLSSGVKKPFKAAEKFEHARQWYAYEMAQYKAASQAVAEILDRK